MSDSRSSGSDCTAQRE